MLAENVTLNHTRLGDSGNVCDSIGEDRIAVVYGAVLGQEPYQSLP